MDSLTAFGLFAVTAMLVCYALERRSHWFVLLFAFSCALGSVYGFLQGAWPFGLVGNLVGGRPAALDHCATSLTFASISPLAGGTPPGRASISKQAAASPMRASAYPNELMKHMSKQSRAFPCLARDHMGDFVPIPR
jgi:hypothetical protein